MINRPSFVSNCFIALAAYVVISLAGGMAASAAAVKANKQVYATYAKNYVVKHARFTAGGSRLVTLAKEKDQWMLRLWDATTSPVRSISRALIRAEVAWEPSMDHHVGLSADGLSFAIVDYFYDKKGVRYLMRLEVSKWKGGKATVITLPDSGNLKDGIFCGVALGPKAGSAAVCIRAYNNRHLDDQIILVNVKQKRIVTSRGQFDALADGHGLTFSKGLEFSPKGTYLTVSGFSYGAAEPRNHFDNAQFFMTSKDASSVLALSNQETGSRVAFSPDESLIVMPGINNARLAGGVADGNVQDIGEMAVGGTDFHAVSDDKRVLLAGSREAIRMIAQDGNPAYLGKTDFEFDVLAVAASDTSREWRVLTQAGLVRLPYISGKTLEAALAYTDGFDMFKAGFHNPGIDNYRTAIAADPFFEPRMSVEDVQDVFAGFPLWIFGWMLQEQIDSMAAQLELAPSLGLTVKKDRRGVFTANEVTPDGWADRAGLKSGDRITSIDGVKLTKKSSFAAIEDGMPVGKSTAFEGRRGKRQKISGSASVGAVFVQEGAESSQVERLFEFGYLAIKAGHHDLGIEAGDRILELSTKYPSIYEAGDLAPYQASLTGLAMAARGDLEAAYEYLLGHKYLRGERGQALRDVLDNKWSRQAWTPLFGLPNKLAFVIGLKENEIGETPSPYPAAQKYVDWEGNVIDLQAGASTVAEAENGGKKKPRVVE